MIRKSLFILLVALTLSGCAQLADSGASSAMPDFDSCSRPPAPDYSKAESWLAQPSQSDGYAVDVFWVYPTILTGGTNWLMDITDQNLIARAQHTVNFQAGVFAGSANLYAPLYRQMNIAGLSLPEDGKNKALQPGKDDVVRAFEYYIKNLNRGRPFILAGHSQGSNILADFVKEKWGSLGVEDRLVAGYLIGWSITEDDLAQNPHLRMSQSPTDTGCFIAYNSIASGKQGLAPTLLPGSVAVNPLSWTVNSERVPASQNLGAVFFNDDGTFETYPGFTSAQVSDGGVVCEVADPGLVENSGNGFPEGVYHAYDYSLFYENLKANVAQRIESFLSQTPQN